MAGSQSEMKPLRIICSAALLSLAWFPASVGVHPAVAQEPSARNELIAPPIRDRAGPGASAPDAAQTRDVVAVARVPTGNLWPPEGAGHRNPLWVVPMVSLPTTRDRPIFSSSRRPPALAAPQIPQVAPNNQPSLPALTLMATVAEGDEGIAVFRDETSKNVLRLHTGESHLGWTLSAVRPREATMLRGDLSAVLDIPSPPAN